ncbi:serine threonine- kinase pim-2-like protein [Labeo rohita]|uniref:non-specific serine/threonine protein kinase n=1 Tax=Labeo rohita TaxID=84645 RepID=A0A498NZZ4_LABRO|nr:serine threonine- kinase pim-2-like protein [Labeo rohita]RXN37481.1 serine threonine- kinase pim-2-like protein [Labeo rohita]
MSGQICDQHHHDQVKLIDFICGEIIKSGGYKGVFIGYACPPEYFVDFEYEAETTTVWSLSIVMYRTVCGRQPFTDQHDGLSFDSRVSTVKHQD